MTLHDWHEAASWAFLILLLAAPLGAVVWKFLRVPYTPIQYVYFILALWLVRVLWRARSPRELGVPKSQGAVVLCNHRSSIDPFFLQVIAPGPIRWMVAREFCEHPLFRLFLEPCDVIPVNRGGVDTAATKLAIKTVQNGGWVGMFPEGRINSTQELLLPGRPGAVVIAIKARVPVLPCYVEGSPYGGAPWSPLFMPARVRVVVGELLDLSEAYGREGDRQVVADCMMRCMKAIAALAGQPDYQPQLAGRKWLAEGAASA